MEEYESKAAKACSMIISSVSPSLQQFILTLTDPAKMWAILKSQLDSTKANSGPFILRNQLYQEKYISSKDTRISVFFAKLQQYQTRLATTACSVTDNDLISYVLTQGTLPSQFENTLEYLRLQLATLS